MSRYETLTNPRVNIHKSCNPQENAIGVDLTIIRKTLITVSKGKIVRIFIIHWQWAYDSEKKV